MRDHYKNLLSSGNWLIVKKGWHRGEQGVNESICALGNGYLGSRGILEEIPYDAQPGTFIAGLFGHTGSNVPELINVPNPIHFRIRSDGEKLGLIAMEYSRHERTLDLQKGVLFRKTRFLNSRKERFDYQSMRFFSMDDPHIGVMQVRFTPLDKDTDIIVESLTDTSITNKDVLNEGRKRHFEVSQYSNTKGINYVSVRTFTQKREVGYASTLEIKKGGNVVRTSDRVCYIAVKKGQTVQFTKTFAIYNSNDCSPRGCVKRRCVNRLRSAVEVGHKGLLQKHTAAWRKRWDTADILIEGNEKVQTAIRFSIYHLLICGNETGSKFSIGARTLSGEGYRGHVFWDTEIFIFPFFVYTAPHIACNLLAYRYNTLNEARKNAKKSGYKGALFAWESADTGKETTPSRHRDLDGRVINIYTGEMEHHIAADVPYAVNKYHAVTGDDDFMMKMGLEIFFECARFWASRVTYVKSNDTYSIKHVIGPDEFHVDVDDDAFTNVMARWVLVRAVQLYREHETKPSPRFRKMAVRIGLKEGEVRNWARISNRIKVKTGDGDIIEQFKGFFKRKYVRVAGLDNNFMPVVPPGVEFKTIGNTQLVKQPDVVSIFHLFPGMYTKEKMRKNFHYYDMRTLHKSSLSPSITAAIGWYLGEKEIAYKYFLISLFGDLENIYGNTAEGVHAAALGGNWQVVVHGFAGIRIEGGRLVLAPDLPYNMKSISFLIYYKGCPIRITIKKRLLEVKVSSREHKRLNVTVFERQHSLVNGKKYLFKIPKR